MSQEVVIAGAKRTPIGSFQGAFSNTSAVQLGASAIAASLQSSQINSEEVDQCIMGQVLTAGSGQAPARQAALGAGLSHHTPCMTINKVCGSGLKAVMLAADAIQLGHSQIVVAGGQENMTMSPFLLKGARDGYRLGHQQALDSVIFDGLWDPYNDFHMGAAAEICAKEYNFSREEQDAFCIESYQFAQAAQKNGHFENEIATVSIQQRKNTLEINRDEEPERVQFEKIPNLRPVFDKEGSVTAANASSLNDGAAALVLTSSDKARELGVTPMAKIITQSTFAQEPKWFTTAPVGAIKLALKNAGMQASDIDLWEINEAFSNVTMAAMKEFNLARNQVNVHGGAVALGHPIGASGARILTTLLHALRTQDKKTGLATLCIGGGEAVAVIVERLS